MSGRVHWPARRQHCAAVEAKEQSSYHDMAMDRGFNGNLGVCHKLCDQLALSCATQIQYRHLTHLPASAPHRLRCVNIC